MKRKLAIQAFNSFEEENQRDYKRWAKMTPLERLQELSELQDRKWGPDWRTKPMERIASWETVDW
jgi:hypothetical protein